jgi:hypothetical protein
VHQVTKHIDGVEGLRGFPAVQPCWGFASEQGVENVGSLGQDFESLVDLELHFESSCEGL